MDWGENFEQNLVEWFRKNRREMPWREDPTPYHVVVSELMLQQTRVDTVLPYYKRFIERCPDFKSLSEVPDDTLMKLWEGLGYYTRAGNLKKLAIKVTEEYDGQLPADYLLLTSLPGIGPYTAGAVSSIAYHLPVPLLDGNVLRVITRYFGLRLDIGKEETKKNLRDELGKLLEKGKTDPSEFNQGLMELGALVCMPSGMPKCEKCPLRKRCKTCEEKSFSEIPVKEAKTKVLTEKKTVLIFRKEDKIGVLYREKEGLLSSLYGYPMLEKKLSEKALKKELADLGNHILEIRSLGEKKHVFSHRIWEMTGYEIKLSKDIKNKFLFRRDEIRFFTPEKIEKEIPLPTAFRKWKISE